MATYNGANFTNSVPQPAPVGAAGKLVVLDSGLVSVTANLANLDSGTLFVAPAGFTVLFTLLKSTDMDTNGAPTATINVGDAGAPTRLVSGSTVAQTGTVAQSIMAAALGYQYTADTPILWQIPTGPATGTTGSFRVLVIGYYSALVFS